MKFITLLPLIMLTMISFAQHKSFIYQVSDQVDTGIKGSKMKDIAVTNPPYDSIYFWTYAEGTTEWVISGKDDDFIYNGENLLSRTHYQFDGTWVPDEMEVRTYDGQGNMLSHLIKQYNSGSWENASLSTFTYDENNNNTFRIDQFWSDGNWQNDYKLIYTYDEMGNNLTILSYTSDSTNAWFNNKWTVLTYTENNDRLTIFAQMWHDTAWVNWYNYSYFYDDSARVSLIHQKSWYQNDWNIQRKDHYHYSNNNMDTIWSEELRDGLWQKNQITMQWFDEYDRRIRSLSRYFFFDEWINMSQDTIGYDSRGNANLGIMENWNLQEWEPVFRFCNTFNENNIRTDYSVTDYQWEEIRGDSTHCFLRAALGTDDSKTPEIGVYPNPTSGILAISGADNLTAIELCNLTGKRIAILKKEHGTTDLSGLPNGIYLLKMILGDKVVMKKIVKR